MLAHTSFCLQWVEMFSGHAHSVPLLWKGFLMLKVYVMKASGGVSLSCWQSLDLLDIMLIAQEYIWAVISVGARIAVFLAAETQTS